MLDVLTDQDMDKDQLQEELQCMVREIFTFQIMAQMSLGRNWQDLDSDEQDEFVSLFTRLLENTYFQKLEDHLSEIRDYSDDDMQVTDEILFSSRKAEVKSKIVYDDQDVPVNYRFVKTDDAWKIYDVLVEEVSLVQNYRSQFNDRLQKVSVSELMQEMRDKVQKLESGEEEDPEL
ncbi:MAG: MlaC/ttg2D family ABC transporter substrate-binding protein [Thermodesulfobacteriota bacterium]